MLGAADLDTFVKYRNDQQIARYQDWPLPYTHHDAERLLAGQAEHDGPVPDGDMVQLAIEHAGTIVGDIGVDLRFGGATAGIGYTLMRSAHGRGLAVEAVGGVVDALFRTAGVRRVIASTDPENLASIRVLDLLGFTCEGLARRAEPIRGEWLDDLRFGLLADERLAWLGRPRAYEQFELVEMRHEHTRAVASLTTHQHQRHLVSPMSKTLAEAISPPDWEGHPMRPWHRVIVADGHVAGFAMVGMPTPTEPAPYLWRLLIDRGHQGRGLGAATVRAIAEHFRAEGCTLMTTSFVPGLGSPQRFYEGLGFRLNGREDDGELEAELAL